MPEFKSFVIEIVPKISCILCSSPGTEESTCPTSTYPHPPTSSPPLPLPKSKVSIWQILLYYYWQAIPLPLSSTKQIKPVNAQIFKGLWFGQVGSWGFCPQAEGSAPPSPSGHSCPSASWCPFHPWHYQHSQLLLSLPFCSSSSILASYTSPMLLAFVPFLDRIGQQGCSFPFQPSFPSLPGQARYWANFWASLWMASALLNADFPHAQESLLALKPLEGKGIVCGIILSLDPNNFRETEGSGKLDSG